MKINQWCCSWYLYTCVWTLMVIFIPPRLHSRLPYFFKMRIGCEPHSLVSHQVDQSTSRCLAVYQQLGSTQKQIRNKVILKSRVMFMGSHFLCEIVKELQNMWHAFTSLSHVCRMLSYTHTREWTPWGKHVMYRKIKKKTYSVCTTHVAASKVQVPCWVPTSTNQTLAVPLSQNGSKWDCSGTGSLILFPSSCAFFFWNTEYRSAHSIYIQNWGFWQFHLIPECGQNLQQTSPDTQQAHHF